MPIPLTDLQGINPTSIIELFELELDKDLHGTQALGWAVWTSNTKLQVGDERRATTNQTSGLVFRVKTAVNNCKTGSGEPSSWPTTAGGTVTDNEITWEGVVPTYYFHNGAASNDAAYLRFGGQAYQRLPIEAEGFEYRVGKTGTLPRPTVRISNLFNTVTAILNEVNEETTGNDLTGAKLTRRRTLAKYIDYENFGTEGFIISADDSGIATEDDGTIQMEELADPSMPDATQQLPEEIYYIDRKSLETRNMVEFELASAFDLAGVRVTKRQCLPAEFPGIGTFV